MQVEYVDHMGSDINVVNAARVSFAKEVVEFDLEKDTKLINYLAKHNHWSPLAHTSITIRVKAPIFMARQFVKHQVGMCLSGDTTITFVKKTNGVSNGIYTKSLNYIADMWFGRIKYQSGQKGKNNVSNSHIRVFNETTQRFEESKIVGVLDSGIKSVYTITDSFGNELKATEDHKILTQRGWVEVKSLCVDDRMIRHDVGETFGYTSTARGTSSDVIARRNYRKLILEKDNCERCQMLFDKESLQVDHIISVLDGGSHSLDNLQTLCLECHKGKTAGEVDKGKTTLLPKYVSIDNIKYTGEEQCYDLSVEGIHNFLGNGFVVHNCWNEESRRYIDDTPEFYLPTVWRGKPITAKQGSSNEDVSTAVAWRGEFYECADITVETLARNSTEDALFNYTCLLSAGVAPEQARIVLPQNTMTNWMWTGSLVAFARVCKLRLDSHAQKEAQELAQKIHDVVAPLYPVSWKALMDNN